MTRRWLAFLLIPLSAQALAVERVFSRAPSLSEMVFEPDAAVAWLCDVIALKS